MDYIEFLNAEDISVYFSMLDLAFQVIYPPLSPLSYSHWICSDILLASYFIYGDFMALYACCCRF